MSEPTDATRREFMIGGTAATLCAGCSAFTRQAKVDAQINADSGSITLDGNATRKLSTMGASYRIAVPNGPRLLVLRGEAGLVALSSECTHWGSDVELNDGGDLECPTHGSRFSARTGALLEGPASSPLQQYVVRENPASGSITISLANGPT